MPRGSHLSLRSILFVAAGLIAGGSSGILLASLSGLSSASLFLQRAYHSYEQLALVSQLESDILVLLLEEEQGAAERDVPLSPAGARAQDIERTLAVYLASIRSELESRRGTGEADGAAGELEQALALRDLFRAMLGDLGRTGEKPGRSGDGIRPAIAAQRTADLRARVHRIVEGERAEVAEAIEAMAATRSRFQRWAIVIGAAAVGGLLAMLLYLNRSLITPIAALGIGAQRIGNGELEARVEPHGARDVAELGRQFNIMAGQLADQQTLLQRSNERLEETVRERTRELEAKTDQLAGIDRSRRLFFSKVSHELRTPVTVLRGEAEVALRSGAADAVSLREALRHIVANSDHLERRLSDLLMLARAEDGRVALQKQPVDLIGCLREAGDFAQAYARSSSVRLSLETSLSNAPILGDASWLRQAILAVIDNAVKHSPADGTVIIRAMKCASTITVEIADEGEGAPSEALGDLFNPYFQTEDGRRRGGSGLGLAVARWVTEQHGGRISARNLDTGGLIVSMTFPCEDA